MSFQTDQKEVSEYPDMLSLAKLMSEMNHGHSI
jgi:hypothetical protein